MKPKKPARKAESVLTPTEKEVAKETTLRIRAKDDPTSPLALATLERTEEILSLRIQGFGDAAIAAKLRVPLAEIRNTLFEVARSFKERQWLHYSEFLTIRLHRQESVVGKILELVDHEDPYVRIAAYGELRKDAEGLAKMFGIDKLASGGTNVSINLGGTIDPNLYKLQTAMMEAVADNPALRETFVQRLGEKTDDDATIIDITPGKP